MLIYNQSWELMNSVGSHGSWSLPFVMKVMVCQFVSHSHEVMTALIVVLPLIVVGEISLQLYLDTKQCLQTLGLGSYSQEVCRKFVYVHTVRLSFLKSYLEVLAL
jgi:hypothetical protein